MARYRMVRPEFWRNPIAVEEMTPEDKYFYFYLLTNPETKQIGIYRITKKQMALDLGYSIESVEALMERFINHHKLIRYNPETRELAIKNWGKENLEKGGKPVIDCIISELKEVEDRSLIQYVSESIHKQAIRSLYDSFYKQEEMFFDMIDKDSDENNTYITQIEDFHDSFAYRLTTGGQKEKQKEKEKQQEAFYQSIDHNQDQKAVLQNKQKIEDVKEIVQFWDANGFGFSNVNAKQQLLSWLDDSNFLQPKEMILKAMNIACANNKRKLNYIVGILKNWEKESLLTVEEVDAYEMNQKPEHKSRKFLESPLSGRSIPSGFTQDLTAGEE